MSVSSKFFEMSYFHSTLYEFSLELRLMGFSSELS